MSPHSTVHSGVVRKHSFTASASNSVPPPAARAGTDIDHGVIAAAIRDTKGAFARIAWRHGGAWRTADWRGAALVMYAGASRTADDGIVVLITGALGGSGFSVFAVRGEWRDSVVWSNPVVVDRLEGSFSLPSLARLGGDSLVAVWHRNANGGKPGRMMTAVTADGGRHWTLTPPSVSESAMDSQELAVDTAGVLHMVYRAAKHDNMLNERGFIMHAVWRSAVWSTPQVISARESDTGPMIGSAPAGRLMAMWTEAIHADPRAPMPKSVASLWTPGCVSK